MALNPIDGDACFLSALCQNPNPPAVRGAEEKNALRYA
jgi:hypothetical protein